MHIHIHTYSLIYTHRIEKKQAKSTAKGSWVASGCLGLLTCCLHKSVTLCRSCCSSSSVAPGLVIRKSTSCPVILPLIQKKHRMKISYNFSPSLKKKSLFLCLKCEVCGAKCSQHFRSAVLGCPPLLLMNQFKAGDSHVVCRLLCTDGKKVTKITSTPSTYTQKHGWQ